jgi:hypothetical protein
MDARVACTQKYGAETVQRGGEVVFFLPDWRIELGSTLASRERGETFWALRVTERVFGRGMSEQRGAGVACSSIYRGGGV